MIMSIKGLVAELLLILDLGVSMLTLSGHDHHAKSEIIFAEAFFTMSACRIWFQGIVFFLALDLFYQGLYCS